MSPAPHHRPDSVSAAVYGPNPDGDIPLWCGDAELTFEGGVVHLLPTTIWMRLAPSPVLRVEAVGSGAEYSILDIFDEPTMRLPAGESLEPPLGSVNTAEPIEGLVATPSPNVIAAGDITAADRFVFHISGALNVRLPRPGNERELAPSVEFNLAGWRAALQRTDQDNESGFPYVVEARRADATADDVVELGRALFTLLGFLASREIGIHPMVGLDRDGRVVWTLWAAPRTRPGKPSVYWCAEHLGAENLRAITGGYNANLEHDGVLRTVIERGIGHLLAASGPETLDVRLPIACTGLEIVAWGLLRKAGYSKTALTKPSGKLIRSLVEWLGLPIDLPDAGFAVLSERRSRVGKPSQSGAEVVFGVRNAVVHAPSGLDDPDWPSREEMLKAWQLATHYLELSLLRALDFRGQHFSRLPLFPDDGPTPWRVATPVPWADI